MPASLSLPRRIALLAVALVAVLALIPSGASARGVNYGSTALELDPGAAAALTSLGVTPGVVPPATAADDGLNFPIVNPLGSALARGVIKHSGGISLTAGATRVELTDFWINLDRKPDLTALVGGQRVSILDLDLRGSRVGFGRGGVIKIGPVTGRLTPGAAAALNGAFGTTGIPAGLVLGKATVKYRLFPRFA